MIPALIPVIGTAFSKIADIIDKTVEDEDKKNQLKKEIYTQLMALQSQMTAAQTDIIKTEIKQESWLTKSWRPIVMLVFTGLIVLDWLGLTAHTVPIQLKEKIYSIIHVGIGGYIIGRSAEKIVREATSAFKKKEEKQEKEEEEDLITG